MLSFSPQTKVWICIQAVDFRKGAYTLEAYCQQQLNKCPDEGGIFVFRNKQKTALRLLFFDGQGTWLCTKRLAEGKFEAWPHSKDQTIRLRSCELQVLLANGNPFKANLARDWKPLT